MIDRFSRFSLSISEIYRYWHHLTASEMEKYDLKSSCGIYLIALNRHPEGITAAQLSEICDRNKADVSRAAAELERKGFLLREGAHYRALLKLTAEGKQAAENICERAGKAVEAGGKGLSEEERTFFYETLEQIAGNMKEMSQKGIPEK